MVRAAFQFGLGVVVVLLVCLTVAIAARQVLHNAANQRRMRLDAAVRPRLFEVLDGADGRQDELLPAAERRALTSLAVLMLTKVRGDDRDALVALLERLGALEVARLGVHSRRSMTRARSAELLGAARCNDAAPRIAELLDDRNAEVRIVAARALGKLADPEAVGPLLEAIDGARRIPSGLAAMSLIRLADRGAPALRAALTHSSAPVRALAAQVLGQAGDLGAVDGLLAVLDDDQLDVRLRAIDALGRLGTPRAVEPLITCLATPGDAAMQAEAAHALGLVGSPTAADALARATMSPDRDVARHAAEALVAVAPDLLAALHYGGWPACASEALGRAELTAAGRRSGRRRVEA